MQLIGSRKGTTPYFCFFLPDMLLEVVAWYAANLLPGKNQLAGLNPHCRLNSRRLARALPS
jgi:hypothetical protein